MFKKKTKKPMYFKKSKAAKEIEQEYNTNPPTETTITEPRKSPKHRSRGRKKEKYNKEYEEYKYVDYDEQNRDSRVGKHYRNQPYAYGNEYQDNRYGNDNINQPYNYEDKYPDKRRGNDYKNQKYIYEDKSQNQRQRHDYKPQGYIYEDEYQDQRHDYKPQEYIYEDEYHGKKRGNNYKPQGFIYEDEYVDKNRGNDYYKSRQYRFDDEYGGKRFGDDYSYQQYRHKDRYGGIKDGYEYKNQQYNYNYGDDGLHREEINDYSTEENYYRRSPGRTRVYTTESVYTDEESDTECSICTEEGQSSALPTEPSEYYESTPRRHRSRQRRQRRTSNDSRRRKHRPEETTETERNPYRQHYGVYVAQESDGQRGFRNKSQAKQTEEESDSGTESDTMTEEDSEATVAEKKPEYKVYAAQTAQDQAGAFQQKLQKRSRERLMSVTDYNQSVDNQNVPMLALKNKKNRDDPDDVVYLPLIVMDSTIKLPKSKIVSPKVLMKKMGETAEKPLEEKTQVYVATETGQGNIFEQAKITENQADLTTTQNIINPTVEQERTSQVVRKKSAASLLLSTLRGSEAKPSSDYPVKKSYINVVPAKPNPNGNKKKVKGSIRSITSSTSRRSLVGATRPGSPGGSSFFSKIHKKDLKTKRENKKKAQAQSDEDTSNSIVLTVINDTPQENEGQGNEEITISEPRKNSLTQKQNGKNNNVNGGAQTMNQPQIERKSIVTQTSIDLQQLKRRTTVDNAPRLLREPEQELVNIVAEKKESNTNVTKTIEHKPSMIGIKEEERRQSIDKHKKIEKNSSRDMEGNTIQKNPSFLRKSEPVIQPPKETLLMPKSETLKNSESKGKLTEKKSFTSRLFKRKSKDKDEKPLQTSNESKITTSVLAPLQEIPETHNQENYVEIKPSVVRDPFLEEKSKKSMIKGPSILRTPTKDKDKGIKNDKKEAPSPLTMFGYNLTPLIYLFQISYFFLGLSLHDMMMEIGATYSPNN